MIRSGRAGGWLVAAAALLSGAGESRTAASAQPDTLRVRASEAFTPCLAPALEAFSRASGWRVVLDVNDPDAPGEVDVVVGDDSELTRLLEGGGADLGTSVDLGYLPWVFVVPEGSPAQLHSALTGASGIYVLGGRVGRDVRLSVKGLPAEPFRLSRDPDVLRRAEYALVPRSLAGPGERRPAGVRPLIATAAAITEAAHPRATRRLLAFLQGPRGRALLSSCLVDANEAGVSVALRTPATGPYAVAVVDWWLPDCTLRHNAYNDPQQVLGPPDAVNLGGKDRFRGFMSLGQGGYVTVDMGASAVDGPGPDVRVFQTVGSEPVTLYAATSPQGPFALVGLREPCGVRTPGVFSNHCDFDLHDAGLSEARYFKIEDGEIYPCLAGNTVTEGADIDAIQILNQKR
jgi:hypothetical protein